MPGCLDLRPFFVALLPMTLSCSALVSTGDGQCDTIEDCTTRGGAFEKTFECSSDHLCVIVPCTTNRECSDRSGRASVCRARDHVCISALTPECSTVIGRLDDDPVELFGAVLSTTGNNAYLGVAEQNALRLAVGELEPYGGMPPVGDRTRPTRISVLACDDQSDPAVAVRAARHLVSTLGITAIIGTSTSGNTIKTATDVTIQGDALLMAPSSTSIAITKLLDGGLVWRTAPSDVDQVRTLSLLMPMVEAETRAVRAGEALRIAIIHKGDPYGVSYAQALRERLVFNDKTALANEQAGTLAIVNYGVPEDTTHPPDYEDTIARVIAIRAHVVFAIGLRESVTTLLSGMEAKWTEPKYRPRYFFGTVISGTDITATIGTNDELRQRILGVVPGTTSTTFNAFSEAYRSRIDDGTNPGSFGAANAYDALYVLTYASFLARRAARPSDAHALTAAIAGLLPDGRPPVPIGAASITNVFSQLSSGSHVDLEGASGPLNFDADGDVTADVQVLCVPAKSGQAGPARPTGWFYQALSDTLKGPRGASFPTCP